MKKFSVYMLLLFSVITVFATENEKTKYEQKIVDGSIDWSSKVLSIISGGAPDINSSDIISARLSSERSVIKNAVSRTEKAFSGMRLYRNMSVKDFMDDSDRVRISLERYISSSDPFSRRYFSDGSVEFIFRISFESVINTMALRFYKHMKTSSDEEEKEAKNRVVIPEDGSERKKILVINMKNFNFTPALFPVVESEDSEIVYDILSTGMDSYGKGIVHYAVRNAERVIEEIAGTGSELVVSASKIKDDNTIVISRKDVDNIKSKLKADAFRKGNVILLFPK